MTLAGKRIVVTRATHQASVLTDRICANGGIPVLFPCIAIAPPDDTRALDKVLRQIDKFDWLIFTSPNTVQSIHERLTALDLHPDWTTLKIAVVGNKTADTVKSLLGQRVDFIPDEFTADTLGKTLPDITHKKIFLPQSELADDSLTNLLEHRGATVAHSVAYQNTVGTGGDDVPMLLKHNHIDMLTFTSSSTVENFRKRIAPLSFPDVPALCIGPSTAETAQNTGFTQVLVPTMYSLDGMITCAIDYFSSDESD